MKLTPKEQDRLTIFTLAELARKRRARGIKLNYPEAVALICDEVMEEASLSFIGGRCRSASQAVVPSHSHDQRYSLCGDLLVWEPPLWIFTSI